MRKCDRIRDWSGPYPMTVDTSVATLVTLILQKVRVDLVECVDCRFVELRLVTLHTEDVMTAFGDNEPRGISQGAHCVCCDDLASERKRHKHGSEGMDLISLVVLHVALTDHHPCVVTKGCQQLDLGADWSFSSRSALPSTAIPSRATPAFVSPPPFVTTP